MYSKLYSKIANVILNDASLVAASPFALDENNCRAENKSNRAKKLSKSGSRMKVGVKSTLRTLPYLKDFSIQYICCLNMFTMLIDGENSRF